MHASTQHAAVIPGFDLVNSVPHSSFPMLLCYNMLVHWLGVTLMPKVNISKQFFCPILALSLSLSSTQLYSQLPKWNKKNKQLHKIVLNVCTRALILHMNTWYRGWTKWNDHYSYRFEMRQDKNNISKWLIKNKKNETRNQRECHKQSWNITGR